MHTANCEYDSTVYSVYMKYMSPKFNSKLSGTWFSVRKATTVCTCLKWIHAIV